MRGWLKDMFFSDLSAAVPRQRAGFYGGEATIEADGVVLLYTISSQVKSKGPG